MSNDFFVANFFAECASERILEIDHYLAKM